VLTLPQANRLRERLLLIAAFHAGRESLKPLWQDQATLVKRVGDLPVWWSPECDGDLVAGVLRHGFGEWAALLHDPEACFLSGQQRFIERVRCGVLGCVVLCCVVPYSCQRHLCTLEQGAISQ
jgi:hypothetical protein